jgi:hypothetical protein
LGQDSANLLEKIHQQHADSGGVMDAPRMQDELGYEGETGQLEPYSPSATGPFCQPWRHKPGGVHPARANLFY